MDNNALAVNEVLQRGIGKRELRYGLMRILRVFFGWPSWVIGFIMFIYGIGACGFAILDLSSYLIPLTINDMVRPALLLLLGVAGLGVILMGLAMVTPYQFDTYMPGVESERKCLHCGYSIEPAKLFPACGKCGSSFPLDGATYVGRLLSKMATIINMIIIIGGSLLLIAR